MTWDEFVTPQPPPAIRRRPWDEVLEEFAQRTGRPLFSVTPCQPTEASPRRIEWRHRK